MKKPKIALVTLGYYVYFQQFEGLREELTQKATEFCGMLDPARCEIADLGYIDCAEQAFDAVQRLKREDADLLFLLLSTYVPSAVAAPFARRCEASPTHHLALGIGHHMNALRKFSKISGIPLTEV